MPSFLEVQSEQVSLTHEEHNETIVPQGTFKVEIQREYEPGTWRRVMD